MNHTGMSGPLRIKWFIVLVLDLRSAFTTQTLSITEETPIHAIHASTRKRISVDDDAVKVRSLITDPSHAIDPRPSPKKIYGIKAQLKESKRFVDRGEGILKSPEVLCFDPEMEGSL